MNVATFFAIMVLSAAVLFQAFWIVLVRRETHACMASMLKILSLLDGQLELFSMVQANDSMSMEHRRILSERISNLHSRIMSLEVRPERLN